MRRRNLPRTALGLACAGLLLAAAPVLAQRNSSFGSSGGFGSTSVGRGLLHGRRRRQLLPHGNVRGGLGGGSGFLTGTSGAGGSSFLTGTSGANTGRTGGTTQIGSTSFLGSTYSNPLAMGLSGSTGTTTTSSAFGNPMYNLNSTTGRSSGTASVSTSGQQTTMTGYNIRRLPGYATTIKIRDLPPPPSAAQVQGDLQAMLTQTLAQSSDLDRRDSVRARMDGQTVVLQGQVADDDERRLVENVVKLTPGVYQVRNELSMMSAATASRVP